MMGCKMPWWAGSETPPPDKDKMIADLLAEVASLKEEREISHCRFSDTYEQIGFLTQQLAAANGRVEQFAWATFDGEGSYDLRLYQDNENYRDEYIRINGEKYASWVIPLYVVTSEADKEKS